jgi:hypothetical protein
MRTPCFSLLIIGLVHTIQRMGEKDNSVLLPEPITNSGCDEYNWVVLHQTKNRDKQ